MTEFLVSPAAQADLGDIWDYTQERWGADQAEHYVRDLQLAFERAAENPAIGRPCDEVRTGYFRLAVGSHVLFYRMTDDGVVDIVRVLHQRMDLDRHL